MPTPVTCEPQDLLNASKCFACLNPYQLELVKASLLCQILQASDPMATCDPAELLDAAKCFACLHPGQLQLIQTELLCEILQAGGGGGEGCIICGIADPVDPPECACSLAYNRTNSSLWYWDQVGLAWAPLIQ